MYISNDEPEALKAENTRLRVENLGLTTLVVELEALRPCADVKVGTDDEPRH